MNDSEHKTMMSGNEAIAQGALESGIGFCASYPGTPSTEITASLFKFTEKYDIYVEWSTNEKVALEAATGASWAGIPALCPMKSLGLNVASDFLLNMNLSGSGNGGLVIVVCDDPRGHSSSNEQDSRFYAKAAQIPLLEPSTYQDAKNATRYAFKISQQFEVPVMVRSTTRLSHSRGLVETGRISKRKKKAGALPQRLYNVPTPHLRHRDLLMKMERIREEFETVDLNINSNPKHTDLLVISSGISSLYVQDALQFLKSMNVGLLNLVTTYPLPKKSVSRLLEKTNDVLFVEEIDPFLEDEVRMLSGDLKKSPRFHGKRTGLIPSFGEMNTDIVRKALSQLNGTKAELPTPTPSIGRELLVKRPLTFCAGCTHRNFYWAIRKVKKRLSEKLVVAGDIGCYSLGVFYDEAMNTMQAMGSGIGVASGLGQLERFGFDSKVVSVAGDSTFFHACLPGLINARHKNANLTYIVLDNATTAMTGFQTHPGSRYQEQALRRVRIEDLVKAVQPDFYATADANDTKGLIELLHSTIIKDGLKVLLLDSICRLDEDQRDSTLTDVRFKIDADLCRGEKCRICFADFGCPAINWSSRSNQAIILDALCVGCGACVDVCPHDAIKEERLS
ncbi:MAG: thiamine pyrophosphate-dependent enzyme [Candidatus Odinarchaeota archaeon]